MIERQEINFSLCLKQDKNCKLLSNSILFEKFSNALFEVNSNECYFLLKRVSGDGGLLINNQEYFIKSKFYQEIGPIISDDNKFLISRKKTHIGEIALYGFVIYTHVSKWNSIIKKCGNYKGIREVNDKLYASEGAFIENASLIKLIETNPPNCFVINAGSIKFSISCEITDLQPLNNLILSKTQLTNHFNPPFPNLELNKQKIIDSNKILTRAPMNKNVTLNKNANIVFDTDESKEFELSPKFKRNRFINFTRNDNKNYLLLKAGGVYSIPLTNLNANSNYEINLFAQKLNGNGRLYVGFENKVEQIIENTINTYNINVNTGEESPILYLDMSVNCSGEILISKISINESKQTVVTNNKSKEKKKFVIVIPSYKNSEWCEKNIQSTIDQNYDNYRVIFVDDRSPDNTFEKVSAIVNKSNKKDKFTLIKNEIRIGALENLYNMIYSCADDEIIVTLDGDDWLAKPDVLSKLNMHYSSEDIWMTYGQYQNYPDKGLGLCTKIPDSVINSNSYREYKWCSSHLRTFYAWLFKKIKLEDLKYDGKFMQSAWDMCFQYPHLEMAGYHSKFISDILYIYNLENPINDHKVDVGLQQRMDKYCKSLSKYQPLKSAPQTSIGLLLIATNKYDRFLQGIISSADNYFCKEDNVKVTYYVFTDKEIKVKSNRNIVKISTKHEKFPYATMNRFKYFTKASDYFINEDYLYYTDVDCLFVDQVSFDDIKGNLVGVRHCGFYKKQGPYEINKESKSYIDPVKYKYYFGGGFSGGKKDNYLILSKWCMDNLDTDISNNIIPIWHDESMINKYFSENEPDNILNAQFHYPQANLKYYQQDWPENFKPKLLLLDKNHEEIRK